MDKNKIFQFCFGCSPQEISPKVIITPVVPLNSIKGHMKVTGDFKGRLYSGVTGEVGGKKLTVIHSGIGDRLFGDAVMLLSTARVEKVLFLGSCGGLEGLDIGDIVLPEAAMNGEGFSRYFEETFSVKEILDKSRIVSADNEFVTVLYEFMSGKDVAGNRISKGNIFTIGSLLAEEKHNLEEIQKRGFCAVEMEISAVFRAAKTSDISSAGILVVSDLPLSQPLYNKCPGSGYRESMKSVVKYSMEFMGIGA